jgi:2'-5' RNA ligase
MKYAVWLVPPEPWYSKIADTSRQIVKDTYGKDVRGIYYRVKTKLKNDNNRKLFIPGIGNIFESDIAPHSTIVLDFNAQDWDEETIESIIKTHVPEKFSCRLDGIGDHDGQQFTFFIRMSADPLIKLQQSLQTAIASTYRTGQVITGYRPHITLLYDDVDEEKATAARAKITEEFIGEMPVTEVALYRNDLGRFTLLKRIPLN